MKIKRILLTKKVNDKIIILKTVRGNYFPKTNPMKELTLQVMNPVNVS